MDKIDIPTIELEDKMHQKENQNNLRGFIPLMKSCLLGAQGLVKLYFGLGNGKESTILYS